VIKTGGYKAKSISWGDFKLDGGAMFGVVPKTLWSKKIPADQNNMIPMKARGLLLSGHGKNILIDIGIGNKEDDVFLERYNIESISSSEKILSSFHISPDEITDVLITHLHFDHCGGSTCCKDGNIVPTFKNAKYYIQKKQFDSAVSGKARDRASYFERNYMPVVRNNQVIFLDGEEKNIIKNIDIKISNGHTIAQQLFLIKDKENPLFYCGDIFPTSAHIPPRWVMAYDNMPEVSMSEKEILLKQAVEENWIMFFEHDPVIAASKIKYQNRKYVIGEVKL